MASHLEDNLEFQKLAPDVQKCVSKTLSEKGGTASDQDIAIAIDECKAQFSAHKAITDKPRPNIPGGEFAWSENEDGTFDLFDVPIFLNHTRKFGEKEIEFTAEWMVGALNRARARFDSGHMPRVHVGHHSGAGDQLEDAGFMKLRAVKRAKYEGHNKWVMFADLVQMPPEVFEQVRAGRLPFRSVEILDVANPEIDSLALLRTETPFFRLPMTTIGDEVQSIGASFRVNDRDGLALIGGRNWNQGVRLLYQWDTSKLELQNVNLKEATMADLVNSDPTKVNFQDDEEKKKKDDEDEVKAAAHDDDDEDEKKKNGVQAADIDDDMRSTLIAGLMQMVETLQGSGDGDEPTAPVEASAHTVIVSPDTDGSSKRPNAVTEALASVDYKATGNAEVKFSARIDAQDAVISEMKKERQIETTVEGAMKELANYGISGDVKQAKLTALAKKSGIAAVAVYVDTVKEVREEYPTQYHDDKPGQPRNIPATNKVVEKFSQLGPDAWEKAVTFNTEFDSLKAGGWRNTSDKMRFTYIADALTEAGVDVEAITNE